MDSISNRLKDYRDNHDQHRHQQYCSTSAKNEFLGQFAWLTFALTGGNKKAPGFLPGAFSYRNAMDQSFRI